MHTSKEANQPAICVENSESQLFKDAGNGGMSIHAIDFTTSSSNCASISVR